MKTYLTYDTASGHIVSTQHGAADSDFALRQAHSRSKGSARNLAVLEITPDVMQAGRLYKVDLVRGVLVEVPANEKGTYYRGHTGRRK